MNSEPNLDQQQMAQQKAMFGKFNKINALFLAVLILTGIFGVTGSASAVIDRIGASVAGLRPAQGSIGVSCYNQSNFYLTTNALPIMGGSAVTQTVELGFDLSSISSSETLNSVKICGYRDVTSYGGEHLNYIEEPNPTYFYAWVGACINMDTNTLPPSIGSATMPNTNGWHCINVSPAEVADNILTDPQKRFSVKWWSEDSGGGLSWKNTIIKGDGADLSFCGGANPSGASDCRPYIEIDHNSPPSISSVSDSPDPVKATLDITFSAVWSDLNIGEGVKLHVCKTNSIDPATQTCTGGSWYNSPGFSVSSPITGSYTTQPADSGLQSYYAFVCDTSNTCSGSLSGSFTVNPPPPACSGHNVYGWAWSDMSPPPPDPYKYSLGWLSFSCKNCDQNNNSYIDTACGGDDATARSIDYGVDIDSAAGLFSGHAWSETFGWISFDTADLAGCPSGACEARLVGNDVSGWARALSYDPSWDGWIKLAGNIPGFLELSYGGGIPSNTVMDTAFSPDGAYLAVAHGSSPYIAIYKRSGDTFTKLVSEPDTIPAGNGNSVAFSPDGTYLAVAHNASPYLTIYSRSGDTFTKLVSEPDTIPAGNAYGVAFSPDGAYLAVGHTSSPWVTIYRKSGVNFQKISNPSSLPGNTGLDVAFSPDDAYLAVGHGAGVALYSKSGSTFTKLSSEPDIPPTGSVWGVAFSPDSAYLAVTQTANPFINIYSISGSDFDRLSEPDIPPANSGARVAFSPNGGYLAVGHQTLSPDITSLTIYEKSGSDFNKTADPAGQPSGNVWGVAFSPSTPDGTYLAVGHTNNPFLTIYESGGSYGVSLNPSTRELSGYAWGSDMIGWISFSGPGYGVETSITAVAEKPDNLTASLDHCSRRVPISTISVPTLSWDYPRPITAYEIEVDTNAAFEDPFNHIVYLSSNAYVFNPDDDDDGILPAELASYPLQWNKTYFWRVKVRDAGSGGWSPLSTPSGNFGTPKHAYPWVSFTWSPSVSTEPTEGEIIEFNSAGSEAFGGATIASYLWTITPIGAGTFVDSTDPTSANPYIIFTELDNKIKLKITDSETSSGGPYICEKEKAVTVQLPLPEYKEVPPIVWLKKIFAGLLAFFSRL